MECQSTSSKYNLCLLKSFAIGLIALSAIFFNRLAYSAPGPQQILDFDGDGLTDPGTYSDNFGRMTMRWLKSEDDSIGVAKLDGLYAVPANYLGNGRTQPAAVEVRDGNLIWNILDTTNNQLYSIPFGKAGDTVLSGCNFISSTQSTLSFIRGRTLYVRKINGGTRKIKLRNVLRGDFSGCGDTNGNGIDELIARTPAHFGTRVLSNKDSISVFTNRGFNKVFKKVKKYDTLISVRRPNSDEIPLVILSRGLASDAPGARIEALRGDFEFPTLPLTGSVELTSGIFKDSNDHSVSGLLWRPKGQNRIIKRLLVEGSRDTEVFRIWSLERLVKSVNVFKTKGAF